MTKRKSIVAGVVAIKIWGIKIKETRDKGGKRMFVLWGERKKLARVTRIENGVVYQLEMPPDSGNLHIPLVVDGKNKDEYTEVSDDNRR